MGKKILTVLMLSVALVFAAAPAFSQDKVYVNGIDANFPPFAFVDKSGVPDGFDVKALDWIAQDQGFKVQVEATPFSALIPSLTSNKIDIISAAMLITPARKEVIDFSDPVFPYPEGMMIKADDNTKYKSLADLKGAVVGAQVGTVYVDFLKKNGEFAEVKTYDSIADIIRDVGLGRIKAGFGDGPIVRYQLSQRKDAGVKVSDTYEPKMEGYVGLGVRKGDKELLAKINAGLAKVKASGKLDEILKKWSLK
jgi:polar amino acid transport system substrate-binding protein